MIVTKLQGGLGNQIFQWAYAKSLEIQHQVPMMLDLSYFYKDNGTDTKRIFCLDKFPNLKFNIFSSSGNFINVSDDSYFRELKIDSNYNYYLNGFWQNEKYFEDNKFEILKELSPSDEILKKLTLTPFIEKNVVSLHVRRTDYVKSNGYHPVQSIEYYKKALDIIGEYDYIFVFSDDIQWCKDNLTFNNMIFMEGFDDVEDLWLMSMCKNNIIANSSFSWWGAWLNQNKNKKVILPKRWFADYVEYDPNNSPQDWIRL
jgi:hypothetical protein